MATSHEQQEKGLLLRVCELPHPVSKEKLEEAAAAMGIAYNTIRQVQVKRAIFLPVASAYIVFGRSVPFKFSDTHSGGLRSSSLEFCSVLLLE